jgi:hypothetical protein
MSTTLNNGSVTFGDGTTLGSANIPWAGLSGIPPLVYSNTKYTGAFQMGTAANGGVATGNCSGYGNADCQCNCGTYNCSGTYLNLDTGSGWSMYYYYYQCNCLSNCNCNCDCTNCFC